MLSGRTKFEVRIKVKSNPDKLWIGLKEFATLFPKALPEIYDSIEVLEGDGNSPGTIFLSIFKQGLPNMKERLIEVDEENKTLSYHLVEAEILKNYKDYKARVTVVGNGSDKGSLVTYLAEFDKANEQVPNPDFLDGFVTKIYEGFDAYLLKNP